MVRAIAPHVASKYEDPAVVVVDDAGRFASASCPDTRAGRTRWRSRVAAETQGQAVVTTGSEARAGASSSASARAGA